MEKKEEGKTEESDRVVTVRGIENVDGKGRDSASREGTREDKCGQRKMREGDRLKNHNERVKEREGENE